MKPPILLCVTFMSAHKHHIPHLMEWYAQNKERHNLHLFWVPFRPLHKAQGDAVAMAFKLGCSHILFTEHDQWGYPTDGLDMLLAHDKDVVGFLTHYKSPPYLPMAYNKVDPSISMLVRTKNLKPFRPHGLSRCDMITWAFTLVKMSVFQRMLDLGKKEKEIILGLLEDIPEIKERLGEKRATEIFSEEANDAMDPFARWGCVPTDSRFNQLCEDLGIERWVDGRVEIEHGDVPNAQVPYLRRAQGMILAAQNRLGMHDVVQLDEEHGIFSYQTEQQLEAQIASRKLNG